MSTWHEPTGRERAIEALMDRDEDGDIFRVRKVMEEAVPAALNGRPNKITKAALVDQAFALQENVIETPAQHAKVFGQKKQLTTRPSAVSGTSSAFERKALVWKYQSSIRTAKLGTEAPKEIAPPQIFAEGVKSLLLKPSDKNEESKDEAASGRKEQTPMSLIDNLESFVSKHCLMERIKQNDPNSGEKNSQATQTTTSLSPLESDVMACEGLVTNLTKLVDTEEDDEIYSGIWITILSILIVEKQRHAKGSNSETTESPKKETQSQSTGAPLGEDVESPLFLQVGALLPFLELPKECFSGEGKSESKKQSGEGAAQLDSDLLEFFAKSAAVFEERMELQEAQKKQQEAHVATDATEAAPSPKEKLEPSAPAKDAPATPQFLGTESSAVVGDDLPAAGGSESPASPAAADPGWEPQESGSEDDEGAEPQLGDPQSSESDDSSSSSDGSSSSSEDENVNGDNNGEPDNSDPQPVIPEAAAFVESERDVSTDDDDDAILREALGISLGQHETEAEAVRVILADSVVPMDDDPTCLHPAAETPVSEDASAAMANTVSEEEGDPLDDPIVGETEDAEENALPQFPTAPAYPWSFPISTDGRGSDPDATGARDVVPPLDPSNLSSFAAVPSSHALLHLLEYAEAVLHRLDSAVIWTEEPYRTVPGGMGHDLFSGKKDTRQNVGQSIPSADRHFVFQLLVASFVSIFERRNDAIESLKQALSREKRATREGEHPSQAASSADSSASEEQDDPALTLALNYVEDDVSLTVESLENKGMKRKAAAAAYDAKALRQTLKKRVNEWKSQVALFSKALAISIRCLAQFLQSATRAWLKTTGKFRGRSADGYRQYIPHSALASVGEKLETLLAAIDAHDPNHNEELHGVQYAAEIYDSSLKAWSEFFPLLNPSTPKKCNLVQTLLAGAEESANLVHVLPPRGEKQSRLLKIQALAKRMRVKDVLEQLIPSPSPCMFQGVADGHQAFTFPADDYQTSTLDISSLAAPLIEQFSTCPLARTNKEVKRCLLALCHRMNTVAIMLDGFYAITETETEKTSKPSLMNKETEGEIMLDKSPSNSFVFDSTKCSDSIAILTGFDSPGGNGSTVLQRASKVWGTVHSSQFFSPKTGIHRWAVRLDKCERGHVFVGVASSRANVRTYVGGDKYGWGMIGTQALWHDRRKIRGDYGASFRTGSTVIVTLDTNLGTISLGLWRDSTAGSSDQLVQNLLSPKRQGQSSGSIEDWGIAFEGLPLDAKMYPAVGLYQRDDRVTLLSINSDSNGGGSIESLGGKAFYPPTDPSFPKSMLDKVDQTRLHNDMLCWDGTQYAAELLNRFSPDLDHHPEDIQELLPLLAGISLLPGSVPVLSQRTAMTLLPHISRCLESVRSRKQAKASIFRERSLLAGEWVIRANSGDGDLEEYVVDFSPSVEDEECVGFSGNGVGTTGKSKNGIVSIFGTVEGLSVSFLEEWSDEGSKNSPSKDDTSSCVVHGTISLDGVRLEGRYRNMEFGTTGKVAGLKKHPRREVGDSGSDFLKAETLLCLAHGHLAAIIADDAAGDGSANLSLEEMSFPHGTADRLTDLAKTSILKTCSLRESSWLSGHLQKLAELYSPPVSSDKLCSVGNRHLLEKALESFVPVDTSKSSIVEKLTLLVDRSDIFISKVMGKKGSLSAMGPEKYHSTRKGVICATLYVFGLCDKLENSEPEIVSDRLLLLAWQTALVIMEDGIRKAISKSEGKIRELFAAQCDLISSISQFLLGLEIEHHFDLSESAANDFRSLYELIESFDSITFLKQKMKQATVSSVLQLIALEQMKNVLVAAPSMTQIGVESIALCLCRVITQTSDGVVSSQQSFGRAHPGGVGADISIRENLRKSVNEIFLIFLEKCSDANRLRLPARKTCSDSLVLASLAVFMLCLESSGIDAVVTFLSKMKDTLAIHRSSLHSAEKDSGECSARIRAISERDVSYAILRCATAAIHVCFFQLRNKSNEYLMSWLRAELACSFEFLEGVFGTLASKQVESCGIEEWERWLHCPDEKKTGKSKHGKRSQPRSAPLSLFDVGTIQHLDFSSGSRPLPATKRETAKYSGAPHRHLSHWLHILCAATRSGAPAREILLNDTALMSVLLRTLGLDHERSPKSGEISQVNTSRIAKCLLPSRYRARIAFFLGSIVPSMHPSTDIVEGLFCLAGSLLLASGVENEEHLVVIEIVSALRKLYSTENPSWRQCVGDVMAGLMVEPGLVKRTGLHAFLSGVVSAVGRLSFVLLKPAISAPLHQEGGKGLSAHTMIPVGVDAVLSGLLRSTAEGGIVSNIDEKNGVCEVILTNRGWSRASESPVLTVRALRAPLVDIILAQEVPLCLDSQSFSPPLVCAMLETTLDAALTAVAPDSPALQAKHMNPATAPLMTDPVPDPDAGETKESEALETQPRDVEPHSPSGTSSFDSSQTSPGAALSKTTKAFEAQQAALKQDHPTKKGLNVLDGVSSGVYSLSLDVMTIRSAIVLFSCPEILANLMDDRRFPPILFKTLCLAWPEENEAPKNKEIILGARQADVSILALTETKMSSLMGMLQNIVYREQVLLKTPEAAWTKRIEEALAVKTSRSIASPSAPQPSDASSGETHDSQQPNRTVSQSAGGNRAEEDEEDQDEASSLAAQHLREAAIAQMGELGIPRTYAELALRRIGSSNIEQAVHFCLENGSEIERLLAEEMQRQASNQSGRSRPRENGHLLQQLMEMGFPRRWCTEALAATGNNVDEALTWILNNNETLESLDASDEDEEEEEEEEDASEGEDEGEDDDASEEDDSDDGDGQDSPDSSEEGAGVATTMEDEPNWSASVMPLRVVSGRATIDGQTLEVSGQSSGGFASVGVKGVLLKEGKWYYEVVLGTAGCIQLGFGDASFAGHCNADRGDGCGDSSSSFSFDGWRRLRWHLTATEWGCRWKEGDVVGCLVDIDNRVMSFTLNGLSETIGMGVAFTGFSFCGGLYPVVSFNRRERLRLILGGSGAPFRHQPPEGYRGVGEALIEAVHERDTLLEQEHVLGESTALGRKYLPDLSDEEHGNELFSWSHRYYGSDASVHLGSSRVKPLSSKSVDPSVSSGVFEMVNRRLEDTWREASLGESQDWDTAETLLTNMKRGYETVQAGVAFDFFNESLCSLVLLCRKLLLHTIISTPNFDARSFNVGESEGCNCLVRLWKVIETACSVRNWSGEAGAMALAAEALGLGIQLQGRQISDRLGIAHEETSNLHLPGFAQLLTSLTMKHSEIPDTSSWFAAAAEWNSNLSVFLHNGIQSAVASSENFRQVVLAACQRSVRILAGLEEPDTRAQPPNDEEGERPQVQDETSVVTQCDARFVSFITGALLSAPLEISSSKVMEKGLFQAWSTGLLSASLPWRMVSAFMASAILERNPSVLASALTPTFSRFFGRLHGTVARRVWAERAAYPVCSRYIQSMLELLHAVRKSVCACTANLPDDFKRYWGLYELEASSPRRLPLTGLDWESDEGWICNEEIWIGSLSYDELSWSKPGRSSIRPLSDGEGPPMLREGCIVMRGPDWDKTKNEDGYQLYESAKAKRDAAVKASKQDTSNDSEVKEECGETIEGPAESNDAEPQDAPLGKMDETPPSPVDEKKSRKKNPHPKLPLGTVLSIEAWNGIPAVARRVRWNLTGEEGIYRFGGDGGKHDIVHVKTNSRATKVIKKHPFPETAEQCASRRGFGCKKSYSVLLRFNKPLGDDAGSVKGILELPDFGAAVVANVSINNDGSVLVTECELLYGSKDSGWEARFGQPSYSEGSEYVLHLQDRDTSFDLMSSFASSVEILKGSTKFEARTLRNPKDGGSLTLNSTLELKRGRRCKDTGSVISGGYSPAPLTFDVESHAPNLAVSKDGCSITCIAADGRGCAFTSIGFSKGCHYWEIKIESCESGSVFIGCAEKPSQEGSSRFNRWLGWGFVNFRATYSSGSEKVYGVHAHPGDIVGVMLDCDAGRMSFFYDGLKYGEHILNDLGCAFENLSPFGFSIEGCGTGGYGQGSTSGFPRSPAQGFVRPKTLFPVIGLRNHGDRVTICPHWSSSYGVDGPQVVRNVLHVVDALEHYSQKGKFSLQIENESFAEYKKWSSESLHQTRTRGCRNFKVELDTSAKGCAAACAVLGLQTVLLPGDRLKLKRSSGRLLELAEEAIVLGQHQLRLYYKIVLQKNEGQSLNEGGELPHFFEECDFVDGVDFAKQPTPPRPEMPLLDSFKWRLPCGLKVVYSGGAVVRSDAEITDTSDNLGTIPINTIIPSRDILERRVNSCGVVRFKVKYEDLEGYISAHIRGGTEEAIVDLQDLEPFHDNATDSYSTPTQCAEKWMSYAEGMGLSFSKTIYNGLVASDESQFKELLSLSCVEGVDPISFDRMLVACLSALGDAAPTADTLDCKFSTVASAFSATFEPKTKGIASSLRVSSTATEAVATVLGELERWDKTLPSLEAVLARLAVLRTFNKRAQYALPWIPLRSSQEGSALFGGMNGLGPSADKVGRTVPTGADSGEWWQSPSLATKTRAHRSLFFTSLKREFLSSITDATTTPTPLSHDEYELPREIRTVRINRMRAARAMESNDAAIKRKYSVFSQLQNETKSWGGAALRRGYVAKGHGGQKRAFKVKLVGEGVNDYSGPYREVFAEAMNEVLQSNGDGVGVLGVLDASPNTSAGIGENQGLHIFSANGQLLLDLRPDLPTKGIDKRESFVRQAFSSLLSSRNEASREVEEALLFLGRLVGTAFRHGILVDLPLPHSTFWKMIVEDSSETIQSQLFEIDIFASKGNPSTPLLWWQKRMLNFFVEGLSNVVPVEILPLFTAQELQGTICGSPDVDVDMLKRVVEYEGYNSGDDVVRSFWSVLRESTSEDRKAFLQYVWARNRLPSRVADFETPFKIVKDSVNTGERADLALPSASTCFFSLTLPEYSSAEILKQKLLFAIHNVVSMETDFQTNAAEVAEGYRALL